MDDVHHPESSIEGVVHVAPDRLGSRRRLRERRLAPLDRAVECVERDRTEKVLASREVPVQRPDANTGSPCHSVSGRLATGLEDQLRRGIQQPTPAAASVSPQEHQRQRVPSVWSQKRSIILLLLSTTGHGVTCAVWGAELAVARSSQNVPRIYVVEPLGPFEDDPNVTNKKFPGNVTESYRTRHPMRVVDEVESWEPHPPEVLDGMLNSIARLRDEGLNVVYD